LTTHFWSYFEAAEADSRADRDLEILGPAAEFQPHGPDGFGRNLGDNATPSSVNRSHGVCSWIYNEDRQAVGRSNRHDYARPLGNNGVACANLSRLGSHQDSIRMDLFCGCKARGIRPSQAQARAEAVLEPPEAIQPLGPEHLGAVKPEQGLL
jgi:hypothetical protein